MERQTDGERDRWRDRRMERQIDRETYRWRYRKERQRIYGH